MDIVVLLLVTAVVAGGGVWMITRDAKPVAENKEHHPA
jgi:hypothetical protein